MVEVVWSSWEKLKDVELVYTELFIIKHKKDILYKLADLCLDDKKLFGFIFPSFYFIENYFKDIANLLSYCDVLFANLAEAIYFAEMMGLKDHGNNVKIIGTFLAKAGKINKKKKRVVVITCGPDPALVTEYEFANVSDSKSLSYNKELSENLNTGKVTFQELFTPEFVEENLIVDTNGAGDSFAGGFLAYYVNKKPLDICAKAGHWAASVIIQKRGCDIPQELTPNFIK